ncbi:MAG: hypothetical protein HC888_01885 [Candidatus Competibacteraceae bacterium]|nr:hypothetical protein [Candidatus Competibacteraceae bacterium]
MGYCEIADVDSIMNQTMTSATATGHSKQNLLRIGKVRDRSVIPDDIVEQYIQWAGQEIDGHLSTLYQMPVREHVDFEEYLFADIDDYNSYIVFENPCPLAIGDTVLLIEGGLEDRHIISNIVGDNVFETEDPIQYQYTEGSTRVVRVKYPDPIAWIACRLAAANLFDKYFMAEASAEISNYGKLLRKQARQKLNDILNGRTILRGVRRVGRRLYDPTIDDQYGLPEGKSERDIDDLS